MDDAPALGICGLSVTIPHKEAIARRLTKVDPAVKGIEAVNTVVFKGAEVLGYNTDYKAAMDSLENAMGTIGAQPNPLTDKVVLMLGAGGAARAVAYGLTRRNAKVIVTSRTRARAEALAFKHGNEVVDWDARHKVHPDVLINCTPMGMHPNVDQSPFMKRHLRPSTLVFDTVYNPESTMLIKDARSQGCQVVTGVEMFVRQAWLQFKLFTDREARPELMREVLKGETGAVKLGGSE
jgi:3-dehydroquinate dehydratase/shikimate dehydrogenase